MFFNSIIPLLEIFKEEKQIYRNICEQKYSLKHYTSEN